MYIHVVEAEKLLYFVANWSGRNIENVFFLSLFEHGKELGELES